MTAGYSGTPLAKKLGFNSGQRAWFFAMTDSVRAEIGDIGLVEETEPQDGVEAVHLFTTDRRELEALLARLRYTLSRDWMEG